MDINNTGQTNNSLMSARPNTGGALDYDLKSEKQEIEEITKEIKSELLAKWKKSYANAQIFPVAIAAMHQGAVNFLLEFNRVSEYDNIARQVGLDAKGRNALPKVVWQIAQSKNWNNLDDILEKNLPLVHSAHVQVVDLLKKNILDKAREISEKAPAQVQNEIVSQTSKKEVKIPLAKALEQYPKVGEQAITTNQIKLRVISTPVRPSIKNWIADFFDVMGAKKHSPIDRGNFLFHSENGKKLSASDRQRLAVVLKSLDEEIPLLIDTENEKVIFVETGEGEEQPASSADRSSVISHQSSSNPVIQNRSQNFEKIVDTRKPQQAVVQKQPQDFVVREREEKPFEIPGSKPPIGSSEFFAPETKETKIVEQKKQPEQMNDDELFEKFQKMDTKKVAGNFSPNFASTAGKISFSSPQKFSVEQQSKPAQTQAQIAAPIQKAQQPETKNQPQQTAQKNLVDLRSI